MNFKNGWINYRLHMRNVLCRFSNFYPFQDNAPFIYFLKTAMFRFSNIFRVPADIYMHKVNNRNTRTRCKECSKLTIKTSERRQWRRSGVFIVNFEHCSHLVLVFLLLTLSR